MTTDVTYFHPETLPLPPVFSREQMVEAKELLHANDQKRYESGEPKQNYYEALWDAAWAIYTRDLNKESA